MQIMETLDNPDLSFDEVLQRLSELKPGDGVELLRREEPTPLLHRLLEDAPLRYDFSPLQNGPNQWRLRI